METDDYASEPEYREFIGELNALKWMFSTRELKNLYFRWQDWRVRPVIDTRPPFEKSDLFIHESLTFAYRAQSIMNRNPVIYNTDYVERQDIIVKWLDELLPAVDSYRATLKILKAAYERGEL